MLINVVAEKCKIVDISHQTEWYFFSYKDRKYPTGTRTNRATKVVQLVHI
jgi:hypothetical protein